MELREGYKQTEIGVIPSDWEVIELQSLTTKIGSGITPTGGSSVYKEDGRPFVRSQNVGWGILLLDDIAYIDDETHQTFPNTELKLNDVFLNISGASIGRSSYANSQLVGGNVNQHVCIIRPIENKLNPVYLNLFLISKNGQKQIDSFQSGGNRQGLNIGQIRTFQIPLPATLTEQTAIATALSDADALISSLVKLIAKKRNIKQGAMQQLLIDNCQLSIDNGGWEVKKLGEIGKPFGGLSGKSKLDFADGKFPYIPFMNIMSNPIIDTAYFDYVNIGESESQNKALKGDLFFNGSSETPEEVGMCSVLLEDIPNLYLNSFCFGFRLNRDSKENGLYLSYYFRSSEGRKLFYSMAQGATRYNLSKSNFNKLQVSLPKPEEQIEIANILTDMDNEITALATKLDKYKKVKLGMMQNLLTGKIRLD